MKIRQVTSGDQISIGVVLYCKPLDRFYLAIERGIQLDAWKTAFLVENEDGGHIIYPYYISGDELKYLREGLWYAIDLGIEKKYAMNVIIPTVLMRDEIAYKYLRSLFDCARTVYFNNENHWQKEDAV